MHCKNCGVCCINTEMLLSNQDIKRLEGKGYKKQGFIRIDEKGYALLKNLHGHCVFYNLAKRRCNIYEDKPEGCSVYPVILDEEKGIILDDICSAKYTITSEERQEKGKQVIALLKRIDKQAKQRRTQK